MKNLGKVYGSIKPNSVEITDAYVFLATNISPYIKEMDGHVIEGYEYDYKQFTKDEYISYLQDQLIQTQEAICEIYENIGGTI